MLIQVVHSHPLTDSYNHALFRIIVDRCRSGIRSSRPIFTGSAFRLS